MSEVKNYIAKESTLVSLQNKVNSLGKTSNLTTIYNQLNSGTLNATAKLEYANYQLSPERISAGATVTINGNGVVYIFGNSTGTVTIDGTHQLSMSMGGTSCIRFYFSNSIVMASKSQSSSYWMYMAYFN